MSAETDFEMLVNAHYAPLYRFAFSLARNESDACDLTQQTFYVWARKGHQLNDPSKAKSWLFTTLHREFLSRQRRIARFDEGVPEEGGHPLPDPAGFPFFQADSTAIFEALETLDERLRAAVALFYLEDYSYPEIAGILEVPLGTVKSRIARGLAQLQKALGCAAGARSGRGRP